MKRSGWSSNPLSRMGSTIHAIVVGIMALVLFFTTPSQELWMVYPPETELWLYMFGTMFLYLLFDMLLMILMPDDGDLLWVFHHLIGGVGIALIRESHTVWPIGLYFVITELSTPFLNLCWLLIKFDMQKSVLFHVSTLFLFITFFGIRWGGGFLLWWYIWFNLETIFHTHWFICFYIFFGCGTVTVLNLIWGWKLLKKVVN